MIAAGCGLVQESSACIGRRARKGGDCSVIEVRPFLGGIHGSPHSAADIQTWKIFLVVGGGIRCVHVEKTSDSAGTVRILKKKMRV